MKRTSSHFRTENYFCHSFTNYSSFGEERSHKYMSWTSVFYQLYLAYKTTFASMGGEVVVLVKSQIIKCKPFLNHNPAAVITPHRLRLIRHFGTICPLGDVSCREFLEDGENTREHCCCERKLEHR